MISGYTEILGAMIVLATNLIAENPIYNFEPNELEVSETFCLAQNIWFESRNTSYEDRILVGLTTLNRVRDRRYSETICEVVWEPNQFSWTNDGKPDSIDVTNPLNMDSWNEIVKLSILLQAGFIEDKSNGATYYHAHYVNPKWAKEKVILANTDGHRFYRSKDGERYLQKEDLYIERLREIRRKNMSTMSEVYQIMENILPDKPEPEDKLETLPISYYYDFNAENY